MQFKNQEAIDKRYITNKHVEQLIAQLNPSIFKVKIAGKSVLDKNIYQINFGSGSYKIMLWSQMHGNESTTTRAVFQFLNDINNGLHKHYLSYFNFIFIPILNPDGAEAYTRVNANKVDLNRDSKNLSQQEAILLRKVHDFFKPDLALNMHDQRSIFSVGDSNNCATLSFLAPSYNDDRSINEIRSHVMQLIANMYKSVPTPLKENIGRFDDSFNINCIGDMFTSLNTPTILFEAGFAKNDYQRDTAESLVYHSLINLFDSIISGDYISSSVDDYLAIPENQKNFVDLYIENFTTSNPVFSKISKIPIVFHEQFVNNSLQLIPLIDFDSAPNFKYAHKILDAKNQTINSENDVYDFLKNVTIH